MNKQRIAGYRRQRDKFLDKVRTIILLCYICVSFISLYVMDTYGKDVSLAAVVMYTTYAVIFFASIFFDQNRMFRTIVRSTTSILAFVIAMLLAFPFRVILYGLSGYKKYVAHEGRRMIRLELSRMYDPS